MVHVSNAGGDARYVRVNCEAVLLAAGAIHTPVVLLRSGLSNSNIGRHHEQVMQESSDTAYAIVVTRSEHAGRVRVAAAGAPRVKYTWAQS